MPFARSANAREAARRGRARTSSSADTPTGSRARDGWASALVGYGLGNFVWYGTSELSTQTGVLLVTMNGRRVVGYRWEPARIVDGTPRPLTGAARRAEIASWRSLRGCTGLQP